VECFVCLNEIAIFSKKGRVVSASATLSRGHLLVDPRSPAP
jgi:hypothetical protein